MSWLALILFVAFIIYLYKLCTPSSHLWKYGNQIPGPKPLPIVGNALVFISEKTILESLWNTVRQYGPVARLWLGKQLFITLTDPKDIEVFLARNVHMNKSGSYRLLDSWLGKKGMLTGDADVWKVHRKLLTPSFHFKILENAVGMIEKHANIMCQQLESRVEQPEFDITDYVEKCSLDIICETAMGIDLQCQTARYSRYLENLKTITLVMIARIFQPWLHTEFLFNISTSGRIYNKALPVIKSHVLKVITDRKEMLTSKNSLNDQTDDGTKKPKPFLDFILAESNFTNEEIEDEVQTIMFAGHDTTKTGISFCLYALSNNPHVQEKLIEEIDDMVAQKGENLSIQDYNSMKYMDNVIKEGLRIYSPVPIVARKVAEDVTLPSGFTLPVGSEANFCLLFLHNDEKYFEEPNKFKPERFEHQERKNPFEYIPFSAGSRNCVGQKFANIEMKVVLFKFFQKYRLLPATKTTTIDLETGIVLRSLQGLPVRIARRN
ncbi:hypothetical protein V9T40_003317 [Parthenolecanium corni]|uniref:Cytochrome P450 n=1 Tax=Parthenolecanium corni TaxID=536013 RepID=A0AAN9Y7W1_9HEMI